MTWMDDVCSQHKKRTNSINQRNTATTILWPAQQKKHGQCIQHFAWIHSAFRFCINSLCVFNGYCQRICWDRISPGSQTISAFQRNGIYFRKLRFLKIHILLLYIFSLLSIAIHMFFFCLPRFAISVFALNIETSSAI